jgi:hypothetical protein
MNPDRRRVQKKFRGAAAPHPPNLPSMARLSDTYSDFTSPARDPATPVLSNEVRRNISYAPWSEHREDARARRRARRRLPLRGIVTGAYARTLTAYAIIPARAARAQAGQPRGPPPPNVVLGAELPRCAGGRTTGARRCRASPSVGARRVRMFASRSALARLPARGSRAAAGQCGADVAGS